MSFQQGISGLNAASRELEVIGNNIANANTIGAKVSRVEFSDVYANATDFQWNTATPGMGVKVDAVTQEFSQGGIRTTENPLDMAINGRGFFRVAAPGGEPGYTRNGEFQLDKNGYVVTGAGQRLQGFQVDAATGRAGGVAGDIQLPSQGIGPHVTTQAALELNLDSRTPASTAATPAFSSANVDSYSSTTSVAVHDQQGKEQVLSLYFRRTASDNQWDVYAMQDGVPVPPLSAAGAAQDPVGRVGFRADGTLDPAASGGLAAGVLTPGDMTLNLPFASSTLPVPPSTSNTSAPVTLSLAGSTQFASAFGVTRSTQDGWAPGSLTGFGVGANGMVQARYSNGKTLDAAQVALADFRNEQGLAPAGGNLWRETPASGQASINAPGSGNVGSLQGGALEESNVDLTQQLVDMITAQRAYQANAQTIKTQDQMMSTLVNLR